MKHYEAFTIQAIHQATRSPHELQRVTRASSTGHWAEVKHVKANLGHCTQHFSLSNCFRNILQMFVKDKQILGKSA